MQPDPLVSAMRLAATQGGKALAQYLSDVFDERTRLMRENEQLRERIHAANRQLQFYVSAEEQREREAVAMSQ